MDLVALFQQPEGTLFDRKSRLLVVENATDSAHADHLRDFVRHTVALANWARMSGRRACMVFGVGDVRHVGGVMPTNGLGILNQSAATSAEVSGPSVDDHTAFQAHWSAHVVEPYERVIRRYIGPRLTRAARGAEQESALRYRLHHQWCNGALLAALEIQPTPTDEPLFAADARALGLPTRYYVRVNDNSVPIGEADARQILTRWTDQPYLPPEDWRLYLIKLREKLDTRPTDPRRPDAYYDLSARSLTDGHVYELKDIWGRIAAPEAGSSRVIMFVGEPGTGKTEFLKRNLRLLADQALKELEENDELLEPAQRIPVYVPISSYDLAYDVDQVVFDSIARELAEANRLFSSVNSRLLYARNLKFLVAIDGIDEMSQLRIEEKTSRIEGFLDHHLQGNHAVTSRVTRAPQQWRAKYEAYELLPFSPNQIRAYLGQSYSVSELDSPRMRRLLEELQGTLGIPRLLKAFLDGLDKDYVRSFGTALQTILDEIWKTEGRRSRRGADALTSYRRALRDYAVMCAKSGVESFCEDDHVLDSDEMQETVRWSINAGILKKCGSWPEEVRFAQDEFMDLILAEHLMRMEVRKQETPTDEEQYKAILAGLDRLPDHLQRIARIILNVVDDDLSVAPWRDWLVRLDSPLLQLQVIAERRRSSLLNLDVLEEALAELPRAEAIPSDGAVCWLRELLSDRDVVVRECVLSGITDAYLVSLVPDVLQVLQDSDSIAFVQSACRRLVGVGTPVDNEGIRSKLTDWLRSTDWGQVEAALSLIGDLACRWAADEVYARGQSVDLPEHLRLAAKRVLELFQDPRAEELEEPQSPEVGEVVHLDTIDTSTAEEASDALLVVEQYASSANKGDIPYETEVT